MTAIGAIIQPSADETNIGVHSVDQFVLTVPDLQRSEHFYKSFGLDVVESGNVLLLKTFGHEHCWGTLVEGPDSRLHHHSFGCHSQDLEPLRNRVEGDGIRLLDPPAGFDDSDAFWFRDPEGTLIEVRVAPKTSLDHKNSGPWMSSPEGVAGAPTRSRAPAVHPERLSHVMCFTADIDQAISFYSRTLGLRLSDRTQNAAFMYGIHGSNHHIMAFAKSEAPGFHHCAWDVEKIDDIGLGAMNMAHKGYAQGWGFIRHVLGSDYSHYVRDPWGRFAEYACDIDFIAKGQSWTARWHAEEDAYSLWGPEPPDYFSQNFEGAASAQF
jgi:catechol 2,3-dioxygenase-like lactoylglutathione lyase family enzyme